MSKKTKFTFSDLDKLVADGKIRGYKVNNSVNPIALSGNNTNNSKYNNKRVEFDGIKFDSTKECNRYKELKFLQENGVISDLRLQVGYDLNKGGTHKYRYFADFVYINVKDGVEIVEDCKGFRTETYKKKKRLMKKLYGIDIYET